MKENFEFGFGWGSSSCHDVYIAEARVAVALKMTSACSKSLVVGRKQPTRGIISKETSIRWTSSAAENDCEGEKERPESGVIGSGVQRTGSGVHRNGSGVLGSGFVETLTLQLATPCRSETIELHAKNIAYFRITELREQADESFLQGFLEGTNIAFAVHQRILISLSSNCQLCLSTIHLSRTADFFDLCCFTNRCDKANFSLSNENGHGLVEGGIEVVARRRANFHHPYRTRTSPRL